MLKNYFKTTFRSLWKNKAYSFLNISGLAIGIACAAFILLWVEDEVGYNHNFARHNYLYHVMQNEKNDGGVFTNGSTPGPLAAALKAEIPGIANSGRLSWAMDELAVVGEKKIKTNGMYADPSVLAMYAMPFKYGNAATALKGLQNVVISESMSKKFFGDENPVGKTLKMDAKGAYSVDGLYTITGVFADLPANCYYHFEWLSPYETWETANPWLKPWSNNLSETIVELSPGADIAAVSKQLNNFLTTHVQGDKNRCILFGMNDWHLRANFENGVQAGGNIKYVRLFSIIAGIILLIACINFMNLATARSEQRAKEVGVLKVMGAGKSRLISKFISEAVIMALLAVLLAVGLLNVLMPAYNGLVQKELHVNLFNPLHFGSLVGVALLCGLIAGSYPAFYLSSFNPVHVLKGIRVKGNGGVDFVRKALVITQFTTSVILIISTVIIYQQVQYIKNRDLGYNKNGLVYINLQGDMGKHFAALKQQMIASGYVENAATSLHDALHVYSYGSDYMWQGKSPNLKVPVHSNVVSPEYVQTMHLQVIEGRDFYQDGSDTVGNIVVNQSMIKLMGKAGKLGSIINTNDYKLKITGIIKDFVYNDVYGTGAPLILFPGRYAATVMAVRFKANANIQDALAKTDEILKGSRGGYPFEYQFADEGFNLLFSTETLIGKLATVFAVLAIFISCLGLFGLAAYTAERRTKEIGIRKVLGASITGLASLLSKEFVQLVTISCLIAFPIAWWAMHSWLQGYEYRTSINWWVFVAAGISALAIALITVSFQAIKAALSNPIKALRSE